jgi:hypothetical protein
VLAGLSVICLVVAIWPVPEVTSQISFTSLEGISGTLKLTQPGQMHTRETFEICLEIVTDQINESDNPLVFLSKLEMDHVEIVPKGEGKVSVDSSKPVILNWQINTNNAASLTGTLWLFLESTAEDKELILARPIKIKASNLFQIPYPVIRIISFIILTIDLLFFLVCSHRKKLVQ